MNVQEISEFSEKLCEEIKSWYLRDYWTCKKNNENWFGACQTSMRLFVLSRNGWQKSDAAGDTFIFLGKHNITVNVILGKSTGALMMDTAANIAKVELLHQRGDDKTITDTEAITEIVQCMERQNWVLPFSRRVAD